MDIDILERALEALDQEVRSGRMAHAARKALVQVLIQHIDAVCEMQALVHELPRALLDAELIATPAGPELHITAAPIQMHTWRTALKRRGLEEYGIMDLGYEFRGDYVVRIAYPAPAEAAA